MVDLDATDAVARWVDAYNSDSCDGLLAVAHPEIVIRPLRHQGRGEYRGHDGIRTWWEESAASRPRFTCDNIEALHDGRVLIEGSMPDAGPVVAVFELRDGRIVSAQGYLSDRAVLEQIGTI